VSSLVEKYNLKGMLKNICIEEVLNFVIDVMQKDVEFWCKHYNRKDGNKNLPLVKYLFDIDAESNCYNEENVETILSSLISLIKMKRKANLLRKIIAMLGIYCAKVDAMSKTASMTKKYNRQTLKSKIALQVFRAFKKHGYLTSSQIYAQFFLLRPQWLSMMGISSILYDMTGISLQNATSISILSEKLQKEIILAEKMPAKDADDSELHAACW
jgi:ribosomal protein S8